MPSARVTTDSSGPLPSTRWVGLSRLLLYQQRAEKRRTSRQDTCGVISWRRKVLPPSRPAGKCCRWCLECTSGLNCSASSPIRPTTSVKSLRDPQLPHVNSSKVPRSVVRFVNLKSLRTNSVHRDAGRTTMAAAIGASCAHDFQPTVQRHKATSSASSQTLRNSQAPEPTPRR